MKIKDIPVGRIAAVVSASNSIVLDKNYMYVFNMGYGLFIKLWPKCEDGKAAMERVIDKQHLDWDVELLPEETCVTIRFGGNKVWQGMPQECNTDV